MHALLSPVGLQAGQHTGLLAVSLLAGSQC